METGVVLGILLIIILVAISFIFPQLSVVPSVIASILVAKYFGSRWIYERQALKEHSTALMNDLEKWVQYLRDYPAWGFHRVRKSEAQLYLSPRQNPPLRFFNQLREHLATGYPLIVKQWEELENEIEQLDNQYIMIQNELIKSVSHLKVNWSALIDEVWIVITSKARLGEEVYFKASSVNERYDGHFILNLVLSNNTEMEIAEFASKKEAESVAIEVDKLIQRHIDSPQMKELIKRLELVNEKQESFKEEILHLANSIGRLLEGRCKDCPRY
ncbi:MAG: hypothetical protein QXI42_07080 [Thermoproteota archaeon]